MSFASGRWRWEGAAPAPATYLGRECVRVGPTTGTLADVELLDGVIELELAVGAERGFHGVVWRLQDDDNHETFYVRPHQVGNPDSVQYTPVNNGINGFQIYHGPGFSTALRFPIDGWFTIRAAFAGDRAEISVGDTDEPSLVVPELKRAVEPGRVGVVVSLCDVHLASFSYGSQVTLRGTPPPAAPPPAGVIGRWAVSDPFPEAELAAALPRLEPALTAARSWSDLAAEPSGLADLARLHGIRDGRNTVLARAELRAERAEVCALDLGFSDRAVVFLNGRALYAGNDGFRTRDYRFLGSIGWFDTVYLPLEAGVNELVVAVSEDLGGWAVQAKLA